MVLALRLLSRLAVPRSGVAVSSKVLRPLPSMAVSRFAGKQRNISSGMLEQPTWMAPKRSRSVFLAKTNAIPMSVRLGYRSLFIDVQDTPNPSSLKFYPGKNVLGTGTQDLASALDARASPLAREIFRVDGVKGVFLGPDYITVSIEKESEWSILKPQIFAAIAEFYATGAPVFDDSFVPSSDTAISSEDSEIARNPVLFQRMAGMFL